MKVTNCLDCPFMVLDAEYCTTKIDTILTCNLILFQRGEIYKESRIKETSFEKYLDMKTLKPLKDCPLKNGNITVEYER